MNNFMKMVKIKLRSFAVVLSFLLLILNTSCTSNNTRDKNVSEKDQQKVEQMDHNVTAYYGGQKAFLYAYEKSQFKPYMKEFYSPNGLNVLLDSPDDHKHHHALMYAIKVDGTNFWEEVEQSGRQGLQNTTNVISRSNDEKSEIGFSSQINWVRPMDQEILLVENRTIKLDIPKNMNTRILTWTSELSLPDGKESAELGGNHYHGLGLRFIHSMDKNGEFFTAGNKQGEIFRGEERLIPDSWCAYTATAEGNRDVTVAMFRGPKNPGDNTVWFTMKTPFAYLSATKAWHEKPHVLKSGETLSLVYGVAVWDGRVAPDKVDKIYRVWMNDK